MRAGILGMLAHNLPQLFYCVAVREIMAGPFSQESWNVRRGRSKKKQQNAWKQYRRDGLPDHARISVGQSILGLVTGQVKARPGFHWQKTHLNLPRAVPLQNVPTDESAGQSEKRLIDIGPSLITNTQASKLIQPGEGSFPLPSAIVQVRCRAQCYALAAEAECVEHARRLCRIASAS